MGNNPFTAGVLCRPLAVLLCLAGEHTPPGLFSSLTCALGIPKPHTDRCHPWFDEPCPSPVIMTLWPATQGTKKKGHDYVVTQTLGQKAVCVAHNPRETRL